MNNSSYGKQGVKKFPQHVYKITMNLFRKHSREKSGELRREYKERNHVISFHLDILGISFVFYFDRDILNLKIKDKL